MKKGSVYIYICECCETEEALLATGGFLLCKNCSENLLRGDIIVAGADKQPVNREGLRQALSILRGPEGKTMQELIDEIRELKEDNEVLEADVKRLEEDCAKLMEDYSKEMGGVLAILDQMLKLLPPGHDDLVRRAKRVVDGE
jgi:hypothetical protein